MRDQALLSYAFRCRMSLLIPAFFQLLLFGLFKLLTVSLASLFDPGDMKNIWQLVSTWLLPPRAHT